MRQIGTRVKIASGMTEFVGRHGIIIDNTERDGSAIMYRVELDAPVTIPGVGEVQDDLWSGSHLKSERTYSRNFPRSSFGPPAHKANSIDV